jgi:hypothetical protein
MSELLRSFPTALVRIAVATHFGRPWFSPLAPYAPENRGRPTYRVLF